MSFATGSLAAMAASSRSASQAPSSSSSKSSELVGARRVPAWLGLADGKRGSWLSLLTVSKGLFELELELPPREKAPENEDDA